MEKPMSIMKRRPAHLRPNIGHAEMLVEDAVVDFQREENERRRVMAARAMGLGKKATKKYLKEQRDTQPINMST